MQIEKKNLSKEEEKKTPYNSQSAKVKVHLVRIGENPSRKIRGRILLSHRYRVLSVVSRSVAGVFSFPLGKKRISVTVARQPASARVRFSQPPFFPPRGDRQSKTVHMCDQGGKRKKKEKFQYNKSIMAATSVVVLDRGNNTTCTINLHGATVVSWRVNNQEQLFVSKLAVFDGKKAIRGGIPFVFPQFGPWNFGPQHGFGRVVRWTLERAPERLPSGDVEAVFSLMDNEITRSMWNYPFRITYRLILREKELHFHIGVYNPSKEMTFSFNLLLHTYLKVPDVRRCQITGLHGCTFIDKTRDGAIYQEGRDAVTINEWTDRIYQHTPQEHIITNVVSGRKMRLQKYNFPDTVVWNPWMEKARECQDFGDDEYPNMICVEAGHVSTPVILLPGTAFEASQILQVM